jgi:hypothetical protein
LIEGLRAWGVIPHIAEYEKNLPQWPNCLSAREREHPGFATSQRKRKCALSSALFRRVEVPLALK